MMTDTINISNSYDNTEELIQKFPVINPTPISTEMEKNIQNRLLNGFENWNRGYEPWAAWGNILYTEDSIYNVHSVRLTLKEYQLSQKYGLMATDIQMGNFNNMIVCGDFCAIRYDISSTNRRTGETIDGSVMEFVKFEDYGPELGTRVFEGWAGTKGPDFDALSQIQTVEERESGKKALEAVIAYQIPMTENLIEKYPVMYQTPDNSEYADEIRTAILCDFENWNKGIEAWSSWADTYYDKNLKYITDNGTFSLETFKEKVALDAKDSRVRRVYFDNLLISGDWAAIRYKIVTTDNATDAETAGDVMQFLHFKKTDSGVKVIESWTK